MRRIAARRARVADDRGAVLVFVALTIVIILVSAGLAVDLSSLERRGQTLQNTADAAVLAGVDAWANGGDQATARARVDELVMQNGLAEAGITVDVTFQSASEMTVTVTDSAPEVFLGDFVGLGDSVVRDATAQLTVCQPGCERTLDVPPPVDSINAEGSGDGFLPIAYEDKLYSVNHHSRTMQCVDRNTELKCWGSIQPRLFTDSWAYTMNFTTPRVYGDQMYYVGYRDFVQPGWIIPNPYDGRLILSCWELSSDTPCTTTRTIDSEGHGLMVGTDDGIFVFTAGRKVYCWMPGTFATCPGYSGGRSTALSGLGGWSQPRMWNSDYRIVGDQIYATATDNGQVWLHCWDISDKAPCGGFGTHAVHPAPDGPANGEWDDWADGRLFVHRDSTGVPNGICTTGFFDIECRDLDSGTRLPGFEGALDSLFNQMPDLPASYLVGSHTYHPGSNRTFFVRDLDDSQTFCWDWADGYCGSITSTTDFGAPQTYGYLPEGDCLIGLGHAAFFFSMTPDLEPGCTTSAVDLTITTCLCGGAEAWPELSVVNLQGVETFEVQVTAPDGSVQLPEDGEGYLTMMPGEILDLSDIPIAFGELTLSVVVTPGFGQDPWSDGVPPQVLLRPSADQPQLTE